MSDNTSMGLSSGLIGKDTSNIPASIRLMMLKRKQEKKDTTPVWSKEDMLEGIKKGFKGMTQQERDSISNKFDHDAYVKHLDSIGMEIAKKKSQ